MTKEKYEPKWQKYSSEKLELDTGNFFRNSCPEPIEVMDRKNNDKNERNKNA